MTDPGNDERLNGQKQGVTARVAEFLDAVKKKTDDKIHHRILHACRRGDPTTCVEKELTKVIEEILHET